MQEKSSKKPEERTILSDLLESEKVRDAALKIAVREGTIALDKYKKSRQIVEEGVLRLRLILDVEDDYFPLIEVKFDDLHVGYINDKRQSNKGKFKVESYKRGTGKWDKIKVRATPVRRWERYFREGTKTARFAPTPEDAAKPVTVYIPVRRRLTPWRSKRKVPSDLQCVEGR